MRAIRHGVASRSGHRGTDGAYRTFVEHGIENEARLAGTRVAGQLIAHNLHNVFQCHATDVARRQLTNAISGIGSKHHDDAEGLVGEINPRRIAERTDAVDHRGVCRNAGRAVRIQAPKL